MITKIIYITRLTLVNEIRLNDPNVLRTGELINDEKNGTKSLADITSKICLHCKKERKKKL